MTAYAHGLSLKMVLHDLSRVESQLTPRSRLALARKIRDMAGQYSQLVVSFATLAADHASLQDEHASLYDRHSSLTHRIYAGGMCLDPDTLCIGCHTCETAKTYWPCGHSVFCEACDELADTHNCPLCRRPVLHRAKNLKKKSSRPWTA